MLETALRFLGLGLCHQLPERSFFGGGLQVPVCARDTGIYVGFVVSLALIALLDRRRHRSGMPPVWLGAIAALLLMVMAWDGLSSYLGFRETTNVMRLATGTGAGFALGLVVATVLGAQLWRDGDPGQALSGPAEALSWLAAVPATIAVLYFVAPSVGIAYPLFVGACILVTFTAVNSVIVALVPKFDRAASRAQDLLLPVGIAFVLTLVELAAADLLRLALLRLVGRG